MAIKEALIKAPSRGVRLTHLPPGPLAPFSTSSPVNRPIQSGKGSLPVHLG